jgi:thiamine-monophosphate kinase
VSAETEIIRSFVERWGAISSGIGDDAAVLDVPSGEKLVVSTDASVENIHFRRTDISAEEIGYRAAAAAISDLAAMAARPIGLLFALVLPPEWRKDSSAIADGVGAAAKASHCQIVGGNISSGGELSITTTVLGSATRPLARDGARPGDSIYVTGDLGGAAAAVAVWNAGKSPSAEQRMRFVRPSPRIAEALWLASHGATSAIDISDGVAADAGHIAEASKVQMSIETELIPVFTGASLDQALSGGEDYELLVTARGIDASAFQREFGLPLTRMGSVAKGPPVVEFLRGGKRFDPPAGFDHLG